jgi:thiosulfate/3-mercaptopyruvate sulfurtransferase
MTGLRYWLLIAVTSLFLNANALAQEGDRGSLVTAQWLTKNLGRDDVLLLDASLPHLYAAKHIPGAVNVNVFNNFGGRDVSAADMERSFQSWGISPGKKIVMYDQGGSFLATSLYFDLYYHGFPAEDMYVLDGGLAKWQEVGGEVTKDPSPSVARGSFRVAKVRDEVRVRLPEFLVASGDPAKNALVEALEANYHYGGAKFFDRAGHIPNAISLPADELFNADKTFKSEQELRKMLTFLGIKPEQQVYSHCGGGVAASAPFFAMKFMLNYPKVKLYKESQLEWLRDERSLPFWTYSAPNLTRDKTWLSGWTNPILRANGMSAISIVDVRSDGAYQQGHVPYALSVPAEIFRNHATDPAKLASTLGAAGVNAAHEAVIISDGRLNKDAALAFAILEKLGQKKVSVLMDSTDDWGLSGLPIAKEPTVVGPRKSPQELAVPTTTYSAKARDGVVLTDPRQTQALYAKVYLASGLTMPTKRPDGKVIHLPYTDLVSGGGVPKPAKDIWNILVKAGVSRYAEIICVSDDPAEAAVSYFILKLMGFPDVKLLLA